MDIATSAAPTGAVASPASTTGINGAAITSSPTTATPAASTAPEKPLSFKDRALALLTGRRAQEAKAAQATTDSDGDPAAAGAPATDANVTDKPADKPAEASADTVPMAAFQERIGRLQDQKRELAQQVSAHALEISRRDAALEIIAEENQRLQQALRDGTKFDERDETIRQHEIANKARTRAGELQQRANDAAREATAGERQAEINLSVRDEVASALASHPLIHRAELIAALHLNLGANAADVAAGLQASKLDMARSHFALEKPRAPTTVKAAGGGNSSHQYSNNPKGMAAMLAARRQAAQ